jgi:hypothetical protein
MSATSRRSAEARRSASLSAQNEPRANARPPVSVMSTVGGWLRTGAHRLEPIPMSLREWSGIQNRSKFGENSTPRQSPAPSVKRSRR